VRHTRTTAALAALLLATGCAEIDRSTPAPTAAPPSSVEVVSDVDLPTVTVHRTESCECCGEYESYLAAHSVDVEVVLHDDVAPFKEERGVPSDQWSCHTNEVGGYVVEGHVPVAAIVQLLDEAPEVDGIALAGMPAGSPGMPGEQEEPFVVTTVVDGEVTGVLGEF
jgi:hypothetical protein